MKNNYIKSFYKLFVAVLLLGSFSQAVAQTTLISATVNNGGFESGAAGWTIVNGAQANFWTIGTVATCTGTNAATIGSSSATNNYVNTTSVVHLYRDITFPAGETNISLTFSWKGNGETGWDRMRVYLVTTGTTPAAGTNLATGQIGATEYSMQGTTCTSSGTITIPAANAGTTQRLVFSWQNDGGTRTQPAVTLDNVTITTALPPAGDNCSNPFVLTSSTSCSTTAGNSTTGFTSSGQGCTAGTPDDDIWYSFVAAATTHTVTVDGGADFDAVVGAYNTCGGTQPTGGTCVDATGTDAVETLNLSGLTVGNTYYIKVYDYYSGGGNFTICVTHPNACSGTPTAGTASASVTSAVCATNSTISLSGFTSATGITFQWQSSPNGSAWTNIGGATSSTYAATAIAATTYYQCIVTCTNGGATATSTTATVTISAPTGGTTLSAPLCVTSATTFTLSLSGNTSSGVSYQWQSSPDGSAWANIGGATASTLATTQASSTYYHCVITCTTGGATATSSNLQVVNTAAPGVATLPYSEDFSSCPSVTTINGAQTNAWWYGSATGNAANSMYISNTSGATNAYANTTSIVHFYKDITFPATPTCFNLQFDWKCEGEVYSTPPNYDYLAVYLVPTTTTPVAGTALASGQIGSDYGAQSTWTTENILIPAANAGTTMRLVFSWINDGSFRTNPPAAVDNISLTASNTTVPTCATLTNPASGSCTGSAVLSWTPTTTLCSSATGYYLYFGTDASATNINNGTNIGNVTSYTVTSLSSNTPYYWSVVPFNGTGPATGCSITSFTTGTTAANDLPCNAIDIPIGTIASGDNSCSGSAGEPANPSCWSGGVRNTVWYSFVAPAGGGVKIKTAPGSLLNTQIAVYSGACGAGMTMVASACNDDAADCGYTTQLISELTVTGLSVGTTYYVAVDGYLDSLGTFAITIVNSSAAYPTSSGQECTASIPVCASAISVGNPGYQGIGFTCDDTGSAGDNCTDGERGSVWYTINILAAGTLNFNIIPNDYDGSYDSETDYDFVLWKVTGTGATSCAAIASSGGAGPVECNFSGDGVTGLSTSGNAPAPHSSSYDFAYEPGITVAAGEVYALVVENYSNSTSGFALDFTSTAGGVINYAPPTTVTWSGGNNTTTWTNNSNWGGCTTPTCNINGIVSPSSSFQPTITSAMGTIVVRNLTVDPGAVLTLGPNSVLQICENLTNNGTIIADPTSTVIFTDNTTNHTLNGTLSGTSKLGNLTITDVAGSTNCTVTANTDIELSGNFTTSSATSIFNLNGNILTVGGNFTNASAGTTFTGVAGSTVVFDGTAAQTYSPGGALTLNNVTMNHSGPGVSITATGTPNMILGTSGVLTLTNGRIITPGTQEVQVTNTAIASVGTGNVNSFVQGNLRRYLAAGATGSFDFPVGHSTKGYQRANVNFTTAAAAGAIQLLARFDPWGAPWTLPAAPGWGPECLATYNQPFLDNGYWSIDASAASTGNYNITLYNLNYTNASAGYSVAKSPSGTPGGWALSGTCVPLCAVTAVQRNGFTGFSKFATIQSTSVLPVELLSFTGKSKAVYNELKWETASEVDLDRFELESSLNGEYFKTINVKKGIGSTSKFSGYHYSDYNFYNPITYYRLKSVDNDGSYRYSTIIAIENKQKVQSVVKIFPNPATSEVNISMEIPFDTELTIEIKDILGRIISSKTVNVEMGMQTINYGTSDLSEGTYIISTSIANLPSTNNQLIITK